jgi:surface protein
MMKYKVLRDGVVIAKGLTEPRFEDVDADPSKDHVYDVVAYETFDVFRDDVLIANDVTVPYFQDTGLEMDTDYTYTVEINGVEGSEESVTTRTTAPGHIFVSNRELTWSDLPAWNQPDNGSLKLLSTEVKENVPVVVETGKTIERHSVKTRKLELVPETKVQHETRAVYTYQANFEWDNRFDSLNEEDYKDPNTDWWNAKGVEWLVDVLEFKDNRLRSGFSAFDSMPAAELTALPDLDTSNITNTTYMFFDAENFNQPLDNWDTSNVIRMFYMFNYARIFDQPLNHFDTSNVIEMQGVFEGAAKFNQPLDWDTSNVTNMLAMFHRATNFNQDISGWCVEKIANKPTQFDVESGFKDQVDKQPCWGSCGCPPKTTIVVSNKTLTWDDLPHNGAADNGSLNLLSDNGDGTFTYEADFSWARPSARLRVPWLVDVLAFKNNQIGEGKYAFANIEGVTTLTAIADLDTSNLTDMGAMFYHSSLFNQPLDHFDLSNVIPVYYEANGVGLMFAGASSFDQDLSGWCVEQWEYLPDNFAVNSAFQDDKDKHPKWGEPCSTVSEAQVVEEPKPEPTPEPTPEPKPEPKAEPKSAPKPAPRRRGKRRRRR